MYELNLRCLPHSVLVSSFVGIFSLQAEECEQTCLFKAGSCIPWLACCLSKDRQASLQKERMFHVVLHWWCGDRVLAVVQLPCLRLNAATFPTVCLDAGSHLATVDLVCRDRQFGDHPHFPGNSRSCNFIFQVSWHAANCTRC